MGIIQPYSLQPRSELAAYGGLHASVGRCVGSYSHTTYSHVLDTPLPVIECIYARLSCGLVRPYSPTAYSLPLTWCTPHGEAELWYAR